MLLEICWQSFSTFEFCCSLFETEHKPRKGLDICVHRVRQRKSISNKAQNHSKRFEFPQESTSIYTSLLHRDVLEFPVISLTCSEEDIAADFDEVTVLSSSLFNHAHVLSNVLFPNLSCFHHVSETLRNHAGSYTRKQSLRTSSRTYRGRIFSTAGRPQYSWRSTRAVR